MPRPKGARDSDYAKKRSALLRKLTARLVQPDETRPSLRQLALAAEVTVPTLRHYFGTREALVEAVLSEFHHLGAPFIEASATPEGALKESIRAYCATLARMIVDGPKLGEIFALGFVEGLLNHRLGPACLSNLVDPTVEALGRRLAEHQARGEMIAGDTRHAALMLISPLLVACQHQNEMYGRQVWPLDLHGFIDDMVEAFMRAYGAPVGPGKNG